MFLQDDYQERIPQLINTRNHRITFYGLICLNTHWFNLVQTDTRSVLSPTSIGIDWLRLLLSWPSDWNAHRRLVDAVVVLIEERDALRDVVGPRGVTVAVKVRRQKGIIRPLHSVLVSWPLSQAVRTSFSGQVAHKRVVLCRHAGDGGGGGGLI